jgi:hypothetical protein
VLYSQTATCPNTAGCSGAPGEVETPTYDISRRRTGAIHSVNGATLFTDSFTQWDPSSRPIAGTRTQPGVCSAPLTTAYDEAARTVTETASGSGSILCGVSSTLSAVAYDADGNVLSRTDSAGGTSTTISNAIGTTQKVCK